QNFPPSRFLEELDPLTTSVEGLEDFSVLAPLSSPNRSFDNFRKPQTFAPRDFVQKSNTRHVVYKNAKSEPKPESQGPRIVYDEYSENPFHPGVKVRHGRFGSGVLLSCSGSGEDARVEVRFGDGTVRKLVLKFASLEIVG
ncbi:MAG: hypothetical protein WCX75_05925, partial [Fibrobacteraceae bacterium]